MALRTRHNGNGHGVGPVIEVLPPDEQPQAQAVRLWREGVDPGVRLVS
jgi:hypothetical protein